MTDNTAVNSIRTASHPPVEESRGATRFRQEPKTAFAIIRPSLGETLRVEIFDESLFGICLVMADIRGLTVGDEFELSYAATDMLATVKHITPHKENSFLVGLATRPVIEPGPAAGH